MGTRSALVAGVLAVTVLSGAPAAARPPGDCVTVAADGSADFTTVQAAVNAVPAGNTTPFVIKIKPGVYRGQVSVPADRPYVALRGLGRDPSQDCPDPASVGRMAEPERSIDPYLGA